MIDNAAKDYEFRANGALGLTHCGHEVVAAVPDNFAGTEWESCTYLVRNGC